MEKALSLSQRLIGLQSRYEAPACEVRGTDQHKQILCVSASIIDDLHTEINTGLFSAIESFSMVKNVTPYILINVFSYVTAILNK